MSGDTLQILIAMISYMAIVIVIGLIFAKKANKSSEDYFLGGRSLGPWVTAMSAEASDMSGWLLMGLPGVAYWCGLADAAWTAIGLAIGTYFNWLIVSKRLRRYSIIRCKKPHCSTCCSYIFYRICRAQCFYNSLSIITI